MGSRSRVGGYDRAQKAWGGATNRLIVRPCMYDYRTQCLSKQEQQVPNESGPAWATLKIELFIAFADRKMTAVPPGSRKNDPIIVIDIALSLFYASIFEARSIAEGYVDSFPPYLRHESFRTSLAQYGKTSASLRRRVLNSDQRTCTH